MIPDALVAIVAGWWPIATIALIALWIVACNEDNLPPLA